MTSENSQSYPVVDLFAGPGGLGEGFASFEADDGARTFKSVVSIEMEENAHRTLTLRHFLRAFPTGEAPDAYYQYISGEISRDDLIELYPEQWKEAEASSLHIALGPETHDAVQKKITSALRTSKRWALVGGPPCQAYSLVGRSRMMGMDGFEDDIRHYLYREYLKIIADHRPPVFVMENVKGLLSSRVDGELVISRIVRDLKHPGQAFPDNKTDLNYRLHSLTAEGLFEADVSPADFVVRAEKYGVPQARHRMFIVGVRSDIDVSPSRLSESDAPTVAGVLDGLPKIRSGISRGQDSADAWRRLIESAPHETWFHQLKGGAHPKLVKRLRKLAEKADKAPKRRSAETYKAPKVMADWFYDEKLKSLTSHDARSHMTGDIHRYLYAAAYARTYKVSPKLADFPKDLLPAHKSADQENEVKMFVDRFRVQVAGKVSTTITSHISKDGHYFIHYDPVQCRSLTVREAARLQTFPDNYFFEGPRTSQYHQIGNAVPPYLAKQIAEIVHEILEAIPED